MDVKEHDRLSKITLPHKLKLKEKHIVIETFQCDVRHNDDSIFKITSLIFYLLDNLASGKYNSTQQITSKRLCINILLKIGVKGGYGHGD
jgi:hypothetical protein